MLQSACLPCSSLDCPHPDSCCPPGPQRKSHARGQVAPRGGQGHEGPPERPADPEGAVKAEVKCESDLAVAQMLAAGWPHARGSGAACLPGCTRCCKLAVPLLPSLCMPGLGSCFSAGPLSPRGMLALNPPPFSASGLGLLTRSQAPCGRHAASLHMCGCMLSAHHVVDLV